MSSASRGGSTPYLLENLVITFIITWAPPPPPPLLEEFSTRNPVEGTYSIFEWLQILIHL